MEPPDWLIILAIWPYLLLRYRAGTHTVHNSGGGCRGPHSKKLDFLKMIKLNKGSPVVVRGNGASVSMW